MIAQISHMGPTPAPTSAPPIAKARVGDVDGGPPASLNPPGTSSTVVSVLVEGHQAAAAAPSTADTSPGVTIHISQEARAAAAKEQEAAQQMSTSFSAISGFTDGITRHATDLGEKIATTARPVLETAAEAALHAAYLTEIFLGHSTDNPRFFTKAEYVEQYDVGAALGYVRNVLREPSETLAPSVAGPGGIDAVAHEGWNKLERWLDRLHGPKTEYIEYMAGAAAFAYVVARIVKAQRG